MLSVVANWPHQAGYALLERFNYHWAMQKIVSSVFWGLLVAAPMLLAQTNLPSGSPAAPSKPALQGAAGASSAEVYPASSALDSELFYRLLIGEMTARDGDAGAGFALILDSARKTNDALLYQRATDLALQSRAGDAALQAAAAWKQAYPASSDANRYVLQILIALNRINDTLEPLKSGLALVSSAERSLAISAVPRAYARVGDKKLAASVVEEALATYAINPATSVAAWTTIGRMRLASGDTVGALEAAKKGASANALAEGPVLVALEVMGPKFAGAEALVKSYLASAKPLPEIRMGYARALIDDGRLAEAVTQLKVVNSEKPEFAPAWLVLGSLQLQDMLLAPAQASLERYVELSLKAKEAVDTDEPDRGLAQAYLSLAQIAEKRKDFAGAEAWIGKIENAGEMIQAQTRRASILANQGKLSQGQQLIRSLPERNPGDARQKLLAEVGLLRDLKQYKLAYDLLTQVAAAYPQESDILYDQAMMAEKLGQMADMERLLREVMVLKPDGYSAYNALGYSFADRKIRLPEAKQLIQKALEFAPNDPFIRDSLGWVEFRLGNLAEAGQILGDAFRAKPNAEIAAHLGEVLWAQGQRDKALAIWREGMLLEPDNETLVETIKRFKAKL
jgi:tetratricopeptide (TPR) repeat protein